MATVGYIGNLMQVAEYLFHEQDLSVAGVICEAGKLSDDLLTFSAVRNIPLYEVGGPEDLIKAAGRIQVDFFVMCAFGIKIPEDMIEKMDTYNIHPSSLPDYRGRHPTFWATVRDEKSMGITLHKVATKIDAGEIITQRSCPYYLWMTEQDMFDELIKKVPELLGDLQAYLKGMLESRSNSGGSYFKPVLESDFTINIDKDSPTEMVNKVRAQKRFKGAKLQLDGKTLWLKKVRLTPPQPMQLVGGKSYVSGDGRLCVSYNEHLSLKLIEYAEE